MGTDNWVSSASTNINETMLKHSAPSCRVSLNNIASSTATIVMVDGRWDHEMLLKGVEILSDHSLSINEAHILSNGDGSFRDVYHVTDQDGDKLTKNAIAIIEQAMKSGLNTKRSTMSSSRRNNITTLELEGTNRDGLMADVFAIVNNFHCNVVEAKVRVPGCRVACLIDVAGGSAADHHDLQARLLDVLGQGGRVAICTRPGSSVHGSERRLHKLMMMDDEAGTAPAAVLARASGAVTVKEWWERGYPVVRVECKDRGKLLLDVLCTLHELGYFVFHGEVRTTESWASQKFYIKHAEWKSIFSEDETQRLVQCVEAAIEIRSSPGIRVEMCSGDRQGLLADLTRSFKDNEWSVTGADVTTPDGMAKNVFYLTPHDMTNPVRQEAMEAVRQKVGLTNLKLKEVTSFYPATAALAKMAAKSASSLKKFMWRRNNVAVTSNVELIGSS